MQGINCQYIKSHRPSAQELRTPTSHLAHSIQSGLTGTNVDITGTHVGIKIVGRRFRLLVVAVVVVVLILTRVFPLTHVFCNLTKREGGRVNVRQIMRLKNAVFPPLVPALPMGEAMDNTPVQREDFL